MRQAETVTFGGAGFDRADPLRAEPETLSQALAEGRARVMPLWRGRVAMTGAEGDKARRLARFHPDHAVFDTAGAPVFLGRQADGLLLFARDLSGWAPEGDVEEAAFLDLAEHRHPDMPEAGFVDLKRVMTWLTAEEGELAATARGVFEWHKTHRFCARCGAPSQMVHAGWQRRCGACGAAHFPRTDPVVIMLITRGNHVLLGRGHQWPETMYSLLAGFMEPGETLETAVRRETFEEAGIAVGAVSYLASQPWPFPSSLMLGCRGEALSHEITLEEAELADARWVSREEIMDAFAGRNPAIAPARKGAIAHFLLRMWLADRLD